jgi:hypothetical protein
MGRRLRSTVLVPRTRLPVRGFFFLLHVFANSSRTLAPPSLPPLGLPGPSPSNGMRGVREAHRAPR